MDLTDHDRALIRYASFMADLAGTQEIAFLHVTDDQDVPDEVLSAYPGVAEAGSDAALEMLEELVQDVVQAGLQAKTACAVLTGQRVDTILTEIRDRDIDLVVLGKKTKREEPGVLAEKIARKAPCSVLTLPEDCEARLDSIVVATDFSEHSADALDEGLTLAAKAGISEVRCVHVYRVPLGFSATGQSFDEFANIMRENAEREIETLDEERKHPGVHLTPVVLQGDRPSQSIGELLGKEPTDLLIVGARGRSAGATVLLGSVTERLLKHTCCPLLAVKQKGAGLGLLEALFQL